MSALETYTVDITTLPPKFQEDYNTWDSEKRDQWKRNRFRSLSDHVFLGTEILGMDFQPDPHELLFAQFLQKQPGTNIVLSDLDQKTKKRMILWPRGLFKALDCNTLIPTPWGFVPISDIHTGDVVFDETGKQCTVTGESQIYHDRPCCEVEFSTGDVIVCDEDHLWTTDALTDVRHEAGTGNYNPKTQKMTGRVKRHHPSVKTTKQISESLLAYGGKSHNHSVLVSSPVEYPENHTLLIPPYILGCWLGDGTSSAASITCDDIEIIEEIRKDGVPARKLKTKFMWGLNDGNQNPNKNTGLVSKLKKLRILNNKHVPEEYLQASISQRLALLQGLMDTDGTCSEDGLCRFDGTNRRLVEQVRQLVASLGFRASPIGMSEAYVGRADNKKGNCALSYRVTFTAYAETPVFRLSRKRERQSQRKKTSLQKFRQIVAVRSVSSRPVKCIMVDSPSHLYLVGKSYIPTHNTSAVVVEIIQLILNYPDVRICFLTGGDLLAKRQLARVKKYFEHPTKRFASLFPEFCGTRGVFSKKKNQWIEQSMKLGNAHEFTVPCRSNSTFAEPTFAISTAKSVKAGSHFDFIFIDDLVNEQNYRSVKLLEKCYNDYLDICPLLEPTGFIVMTGTRYSYGDTYERIQDMAKKEEKELGRTIWKFSIRDCWSLGCRHCLHSDVYHDRSLNIIEPPCTKCACRGFEPNGIKGVLFPAVRTRDGRAIGHTLEFLEGERVRLGSEFFANQYENNPIAQGSQTFTDTLIGAQTLHHLEQIPPFNTSYTFGIGDLAYVGQEGRDYSVIFICRLFQGQIFVFDCLYGNWDSDAVAENTVNILLKHRPNILYYERFNGWEAYNNVITTYAAARGIQKVPIQWEKGSQAPNAKLARIGAVKGVLVKKRLWFFAGMPGYDILVQQLLKWPKLGRHDDFADTAGQTVDAPTGYQLENPPAIISATNWLRKYNSSEPVNDGYGDNGCGTGIIC